MARILGIDYGTVRMGFAVSDELGMIAMPLVVETVSSVDEAIAVSCRLARERKVGKIVVGIPINMDGTHGPMAKEAAVFVEKLKAVCGVPVMITDERLSTSLVERMLLGADVSREKRKAVRDKLAAQVILQGYLDTVAEGMPNAYDPDGQENGEP